MHVNFLRDHIPTDDALIGGSHQPCLLADYHRWSFAGLWSNSFFWFVYFVPQNNNQLYKCCRPPSGYYIDYVSCYYMPTHDFEFEYYDSVNNFIVLCATGFVMTGISKKINPYSKEYHIGTVLFKTTRQMKQGITGPVSMSTWKNPLVKGYKPSNGPNGPVWAEVRSRSTSSCNALSSAPNSCSEKLAKTNVSVRIVKYFTVLRTR